MNAAVVTGAFALGGVVLGAGLNWLRSALDARRAAARERDEVVTALGAACVRLFVVARTHRALDKPPAKLRQALYGMLESEARHPFVVRDDMVGVARQLMASAVVNGLKHLFPVTVAESLRTELMPLLFEIAVLSIRLSMFGDPQLKEAAGRINNATGTLVESMAAKDRDYAKLEADVQAALGQLRRVRDAAAARRWYRKRVAVPS